MRSAVALWLALLAFAPVAEAQDEPVITDHEEHTIRFEGVDRRLDVFIDEELACRTPCERRLPGGARVELSFLPLEQSLEAPGHELDDPVGYGGYDVTGPSTLRLRWEDRSEIRLAGDVVLIVGVTLGALVGGTAMASYDGDDDPLLVLGITGLVVMGLSLLVGLPLAAFEDGMHREN